MVYCEANNLNTVNILTEGIININNKFTKLIPFN